MAGIQDPLTDLPPPSRLDFEELSNFTFDSHTSAPSQSPPFISWAAHVELQTPLRPRLLFIASSPSGLHLLHHLPDKLLLGSVILPAQTPPAEGSSLPVFTDDGNIKELSIYDGRYPKAQPEHQCNIYSLDDRQASAILIAVQTPVAEDRANSWTRAVLECIAAERVVVVAMVQRDHYRGKLSADDEVVFRLETDALRIEESGRGVPTMVHSDVPYFPSGSLVSGLPAAVLTRCQLLGLKARLLLSWPEAHSSATLFLVTALKHFPEISCLDFSVSLRVPFKGKSVSDLDIYI